MLTRIKPRCRKTPALALLPLPPCTCIPRSKGEYTTALRVIDRGRLVFESSGANSGFWDGDIDCFGAQLMMWYATAYRTIKSEAFFFSFLFVVDLPSAITSLSFWVAAQSRSA